MQACLITTLTDETKVRVHCSICGEMPETFDVPAQDTAASNAVLDHIGKVHKVLV